MDALLIAPSTPSERQHPNAGDARTTSRSSRDNAAGFSGRVAKPAPRGQPVAKASQPASEDRSDADVQATAGIAQPMLAPVNTTTWTIDPLAGPWLAAMPAIDMAHDAITALPLVPDDGAGLMILDTDLEPALTIMDEHQATILQDQQAAESAAVLTNPEQVPADNPAPMVATLLEDEKQALHTASPKPSPDMPEALPATTDEGVMGPPTEGPEPLHAGPGSLDSLVVDDSSIERNNQPAQALVDTLSAHQDEDGPVRNGDGVEAIRPTVERAAPSADRGPVPPPSPTAETAPDRALAQQVSRAIVQQTVDGQRVLQLRLTPPELGTVRIELVEHRGVLQVRLGAEDDGVRAALERALPGLRQDLRAANAPIAGLDLVDQHLEFFQHHHGQDHTQHAEDRPQSGAGGQRFSLDQTPDDDAPRRPSAPLHAQISDNAVDALA